MKFQPWEDFKFATAPAIPIEGPPCANCKNWNPIIRFDESGRFAGVRLCHGDQCKDFSCFKERK